MYIVQYVIMLFYERDLLTDDDAIELLGSEDRMALINLVNSGRLSSWGLH